MATGEMQLVAELLKEEHWRKSRAAKAEKAHNIVNTAIKQGVLHRPDACSECGTTYQEIEAHHENYDKPLEVIWLCTDCHAKQPKVRNIRAYTRIY